MYIDQASQEQLQQWEAEFSEAYQQFKGQGLNLDLTRGKPSPAQLDLANELDGILAGDYQTANGTDSRNYGGLDGIAEMKKLGAELLGVNSDEILVGGNSSLTLMYHAIHFACLFGTHEGATPWIQEGNVKFLCPVPGYDRHFSICRDLDIEMINISMTADGPDMEQVETLLREDGSIKGMWNVPKYSNPTGVIYSDEVVDRIARLGEIASPNFRVFWDNAYCVHDFGDEPGHLANIMECCRQYGTENSVLQFASTSKMTFAGAGVGFMASGSTNIAKFKKHLAMASIGPDKVNQLRHARLFPDLDAVRQHMQKHADLMWPKFDAVNRQLEEHLADSDLGNWSVPQGGYFVSFDARPGLASEIVKLAADAGVKLTPAGATFPYGKDPEDRNIRLAPSFPSLEDVKMTMKVFVVCVKLASVRQKLQGVSD